MSVPAVPGEAVRPRPKRRFRPRASQACQMCPVKKAKCNQDLPCQTCVDRQFTCIYDQQSQARQRRQSESFALPRPQVPSVERWNNEARRRPPNREPGYECASASSIVGAREDLMQDEGQQSLPLQDFQNSSDSDTVGEVNRHTSGTEFYGSSSGFAMLSQLVSEARAHSSASHMSHMLNRPISGESPREGTPEHPAGFSPYDLNTLGHESETAAVYTTTSPLSVINILHDKNSLLPESRPRSPLKAAGRLSTGQLERSRGRTFFISRTEVYSPSANQPIQPEPLLARQVEGIRDNDDNYPQTAGLARLPSPDISICLLGRPMVLEMECEREIWTKKSTKRLRQDQMHFMSLYNMVLAIGALTAGVDLFQAIRTELDKSKFGQAPSDPKKVMGLDDPSFASFDTSMPDLGWNIGVGSTV